MADDGKKRKGGIREGKNGLRRFAEGGKGNCQCRWGWWPPRRPASKEWNNFALSRLGLAARVPSEARERGLLDPPSGWESRNHASTFPSQVTIGFCDSWIDSPCSKKAVRMLQEHGARNYLFFVRTLRHYQLAGRKADSCHRGLEDVLAQRGDGHLGGVGKGGYGVAPRGRAGMVRGPRNQY